jgi:hypothetical protein
VVVGICHPKLLGRLRLKGSSFKASIGIKSVQDLISTEKSYAWWHTSIILAIAVRVKQEMEV